MTHHSLCEEGGAQHHDYRHLEGTFPLRASLRRLISNVQNRFSQLGVCRKSCSDRSDTKSVTEMVTEKRHWVPARLAGTSERRRIPAWSSSNPPGPTSPASGEHDVGRTTPFDDARQGTPARRYVVGGLQLHAASCLRLRFTHAHWISSRGRQRSLTSTAICPRRTFKSFGRRAVSGHDLPPLTFCASTDGIAGLYAVKRAASTVVKKLPTYMVPQTVSQDLAGTARCLVGVDGRAVSFKQIGMAGRTLDLGWP
nr:hypothetical protein CFP56_30169 [Quercus suber]